MNDINNETKNWPDLAIGLFDRLTGLGAEICYDFRNIEVDVPSSTGRDAEHALWRVNGVLNIRTSDATRSVSKNVSTVADE